VKIGVVGAFNVYSGYGMDSIGLALALGRAGHDVYPLPTNISLGLPRELAMMLCKVDPHALDVTIVHEPPSQLRPRETIRAISRTVIGWTMWEQTVLDPADMHDRTDVLQDLDMVLAYDPVSRDAIQTYDPSARIEVLQGGVDADPLPYHHRDWHGTFRFGMLGELHTRKDPFVAIEAFHELRQAGELADAELVLKTTKPGLHPAIEQAYPGVRVIADVWSRAQVVEFLHQTHVLLGPSRGEGKNLPALEAQLTGAVAICTAWGGHTVWQHPEYSPMLEYTLEPISPGSKSQRARASKEHLKQLMLQRYDDREGTRRMGEIASRTIRAQCSWTSVVKRLNRLMMVAMDD
jgi:glycosyltransferase involved in cell wall biosynthesis